MATIIFEKINSRSLIEDRRAAFTYLIKGATGPAEALTLVKEEAPTGFEGLFRSIFNVEPIFVDEDDPERNLWDATVEYAAFEQMLPAVIGDSFFSFDTGGGQQHITQSLSTEGSFSPTGTPPPNNDGAIGVTDLQIEGTDILVPVFNFTERVIKDDAAVDLAYQGTLFLLTATVNDAPFKGLKRGECLFLGAQGSQRGEEDWEITFNFAASPNKTTIEVGDIGPIAKLGQEYLWVRYETIVDPAVMFPVKIPRAAYVERVYEFGNFSLLDIGV